MKLGKYKLSDVELKTIKADFWLWIFFERHPQLRKMLGRGY